MACVETFADSKVTMNVKTFTVNQLLPSFSITQWEYTSLSMSDKTVYHKNRQMK